MRTSGYIPVDMPQKGISIARETAGKTRYVYHIGKGYRNAKGQPTSKKELIGKLDTQSGKLIPNDRYYTIYGVEPEVAGAKVRAVKNYGDYYLLDSIIRQFRLDDIMKNIFGDITQDIILMAIYTAINGNVLYYCEDWCEETYTRNGRRLTSQTCGDLLEKLTEEKRERFFQAWAYVREQMEYIAYDVTSISSYGRGNEAMEYGYNRDGEDLRQINLGLFYGEESMLPIYYCAYPGSINDKAHLRTMMRNGKRIGIRKIKFVMDRGFFSLENVRTLTETGYPFIMGMPGHMKAAARIRAKYKDEIKSARNHIEGTEVNAVGEDTAEYGIRTRIYMYYSTDKAAAEQASFYEELARMELVLAEGETPQGSDKYFIAVKTNGQETDSNGKENNPNIKTVYHRNYEAIDERMERMGFFFLLTTDFKKTAAEILQIYRAKDAAEKCFDDLKNGIDTKRLRVHSRLRAEGKLFISFLALILRAHIENAARPFMRKNALSVDKLLLEMRKLKVVQTNTDSLLLNPVTKRQRDILTLFEAPVPSDASLCI